MTASNTPFLIETVSGEICRQTQRTRFRQAVITTRLATALGLSETDFEHARAAVTAIESETETTDVTSYISVNIAAMTVITEIMRYARIFSRLSEVKLDGVKWPGADGTPAEWLSVFEAAQEQSEVFDRIDEQITAFDRPNGAAGATLEQLTKAERASGE